MYGACRATAAFSSTSVPDLADFGTQLADDDELLDPCSANPEVALLAYLRCCPVPTPCRSAPSPPSIWDRTRMRLAAMQEVAHAARASANQVVLAWLMATTPGRGRRQAA
jgi:hypothetical protein